MMKPLYDSSDGKTGSSDNMGQIVFKKFIDNVDNKNTLSVVVLMDEVMCQSHGPFLSLIYNRRNGKLDSHDVSFIISQYMTEAVINHLYGRNDIRLLS